jgi:hypothetical protein
MDEDQDDVRMETVRSDNLEEAVANIFRNNFDEDSKACIVTLVKVLDNLLHQPGNPKVRTIRRHNRAFANTVGSCVGGVEVLQACGFQYRNEQELELVLLPEQERTEHLIRARNLLATCAVADLGMASDALPPYRPPPTLTSSTSTTTNATTGRSNADTATPAAAAAFNPYRGHRHDVKSAAVGANLGPDRGDDDAANYVSATERQLQLLQRQQAVLEAKLQQPLQDRAWIATLPASAASATTASAATVSTVTGNSNNNTNNNNNNNDTKAPSSDGALLAQRAKRQHEERMQRETGGLTTKAMRDLERIKKQKVYTHCSLTIQFADGCKLNGKFLPKETIATVLAAVKKCMVVQTPQAQQHGQSQQPRNFDLYVTPPRRLLPPKSTLTEEGLVPAAKIFVSWKDGSTPDKNAPVGSYIDPRLFVTSSSSSSSPSSSTSTSQNQAAASAASSFPSAQSVVGSDRAAGSGSGSGSGNKNAQETTEKKGSREEDLLKRMMGGKGGGLGGGAAKKKPAAKDSKDAKPPPPSVGGGAGGAAGGGKPKWFK